MKVKCLYKIGDTVNVLGSDKPMLITGYVLDDNGDVVEQDIAFQFLEPQDLADPAKCVIRTYLENDNSDEVSTLDYMLEGMQLNPNYMTTDRLFMLLEYHFIEHKVTDYIDKLDEFVVGFIKHLMRLKG